MSLSSRFLNLSMKEQICITLIALTLFCIGVILIVCCSLIHEILNKDFEQKKLYFYNRYKQYIESSLYFQNFYLMQYEEIIHRMQKQIWRLQQSVSIYINLKPLQTLPSYLEYIKYMNDPSKYNFTELDLNNKKENPYFYIITFSNSEYNQQMVQGFSMLNYQTFSNAIITHDIYDHFRIPGYGVPLIDNPLFYNLNYSTLFSYNHSLISDKLNEYAIENLKTQESFEIIFNKTSNEKIDRFLNKTESFMRYINDKLDIFIQMFEKFYKEINTYTPGIFQNETLLLDNLDILSGYISGIEYENDTISMLSTDIDNFKNFFYSEMNAITNLLFFLNQKLTESLDIDFIPIHIENNTILSQDLCSIFKSKQKFLSGNDFNYEEVYNDINKLESNLENCFIDLDLINIQEDIKEVFDTNFENFMENTCLIYQGLLHLIPNSDDFPFYFMKYTYPNYNTLKDFQSEYLFSSQVNFYSFASFKIVQKYVDHINQVSQNIFYFIIMVIIYSWLVCLVINLIIFSKVIEKWTEPLIKLQEAVETSNIKDENIFTYEYDDIINELFVTCKELLTGQIDNNDNNMLKNFNILNKDNNNKKIDKNIYKKNLIINNDIMQDLMDKQRSMLDFSGNIKFNSPNNIDNIDNSNIIPKNQKLNQPDENIIKNIEHNKNSRKEKKEEDKEKEPYIKLFQIAEYLNYYRSKLDTNNVVLINNDIDESKRSKIISKNTRSINSSISNQTKNRNDETVENCYINMMDETNITYMWYMETKKKYNNFNYYLSSDYRELFTEFNDSYKNFSRQDQKKSVYKKDKNTGM